MIDYKKASRMKLRVQTEKGNVGVEDLWDLSLTKLNEIAKQLNRAKQLDKEEDFLSEIEVKDHLDFDIVLDILKTKQAEKIAKSKLAENKIKKDKLLAILANKQDESLSNLSEDELKQQIASL